MAVINVTEASISAATGSSLGTGTAGENITQGEALYLRASNSRYELASAASAAGPAGAVVAGISLNTADLGQPVDFIKSGTLTVGTADPVIVGLVYYLSRTLGGLDEAVPVTTDYTTTLGIGLTTGTIKVSINVSGVQVP